MTQHIKRQERRGDANRADTVRSVRKRLGQPENTRFLNQMPHFSLDTDMPEEFHDLLGKLDEAERRAG
ncbi:hypothetical protein T8J41_03995 [Nitratireductor rhodophyticola]|uniref:Anti-sigma factor NepR domain-containing protein n=1 Tax=Nitratireductor rhodophyticola TaxID=2854036 RepID=A0ABS7R9B7_9HYPH|nr:hypothetical protein [Nitratireductor rhodophyticola]MBY8917244.1 hypothetical protein [Nitratireductor rhodophyticola]MBY8920327.1 hypothetical protein [Nitratireductor rhodophyticola]MEC9245202.1 hypothetical protein [Pseudomonadota bacterium]WPZ14993.1 hypothetical protein T8J41_03995 [Nitratireductor rhodophyticola]